MSGKSILAILGNGWEFQGIRPDPFFLSLWLAWASLVAPDGKESACSAGDLGSILELGRSPGEGNDNPLQYSCLEDPMDRGSWQAMAHGVTGSDTTE